MSGSRAAAATPPRRPGVPECRFCGVPLMPHQAVRGNCGQPACEARAVQEVARAAFRRSWEDHVSSQRAAIERAADGIAAALVRMGRAPGELAYGVVPQQRGPVVPLSEARRAEFAAHLASIVAEAFAAGEPVVDLERRAVLEHDEEPLAGAACATCQGKCCMLGGATGAFLSAQTIQLYRARNRHATAPEIVAHYLARLPEATVEHSCVYHGPRGCVLPRAERADICNRYHCNPQTDLLRRFRERSAEAAVIVAENAGAAPSVAIFDAAGWRPLPETAESVPPGFVARVVEAALAQMPEDLPDEAHAVPAAPVCAWCGCAIDRHKAVMKQSCGRPDCERRRIAEAAEAVAAERAAAQRAQVRRMREWQAPALAALAGELGAGPDEIALGVVPDGGGALEPLAHERRDAFARHLDEIIEQAFRGAPAQMGEAGTAAEEAAAAEPGVAEAACATCRGACCRGGDDRAYLSAADLRRLRRREPGLTPDSVRARYLGRLPPVAVRGSCVFHGADGCTLPRADRSAVCNSFRCRGLDALMAEIARTGAPGALIVAAGERETAARVTRVGATAARASGEPA